MSRPMYNELTRKMLEEWGIDSITWDPDTDSWNINRYWYKNNSREKRNIKLAISNAICKHKFTKDKSYPIVSFSYRGKPICLPLARVVFAWFHPDKSLKGLVIDHIDNNPYNNKLNNLRAITQEANLIKRYIDNPSSYLNQYQQNKIRNCKPEDYAICHQCFVQGKTYAEAQEILYELTAKE